MALVIILGIAVALFVLAFTTKRRFGVLGLGIAAGVVLSQLWAVTLANVLEAQGVSVSPLSYSTVAQVAIVLIPALLLLIAGPKYTQAKWAFVGSLAFALLGTLFVIAPITRDFAVAGDTSPVFDFITNWQNVIVALGVIFAVGDMLLAHGPRLSRHHGKDKH